MNHVKPYRIPNGVFVLLLALAALQVNARVKISNSAPGVNTIYFPTNTVGGTGQFYEVPAKVIPSTDGGLVKGTALAVIKNPSGNALALTATSRAPAAAVGAALGKFAVKASGAVAILGTGVALYDLAQELGYIFDNSTGELVVQKNDPAVCTTAPCYVYGQQDGSTTTSISQACQSFVGHYQYGDIVLSVRDSAPGGTCGWVMGWGYYQPRAIWTSTVAPAASAVIPSSIADFENTVSTKTDWPANSNVSKALEKAQQDYDIFVEYNPPTVTGPATTPGKVSTTTSSTGTTITSTTTHNHQYEGANVTTSNVTVNQTTNIAGDTTTTTTTETPAKEDEPQPDQCEKNPDSIACLELGTPTDQQLKTQSIGVSLTPVQFASSATCPADMSASFVVLGQSFNPKISYGPLCSAATDYIRPVLLLLALAGSAFIFVGGLKSGG